MRGVNQRNTVTIHNSVFSKGGENKIRNILKKLRKQRGLTQKEIAKLLEVSRQTVISIENEHRNPSLELAFKISETFDKPIDKIFKLEKSK